jgi:hypothetical protein
MTALVQISEMTPNPVFQISGATYRLVSSFEKPDWFPKSAPVAQRCRSLLMDLGKPTVHWIDNRHYLADGRWRALTLEHSKKRLRALSEQRTKDACVVVGNGPSLRHTDLDLLDGQDVFIANYAVIEPALAAKAKYLGVVNPHVAEQDPERLNEVRGLVKFFPYWLRFCLEETADTVFLNELSGEPFFSTDITENISGHSTVTHFHLQIAYTLGYRKAILIGCDNNYQQPRDAREGDILTCQADDPNHFRPDYFKGKRWQAADTERMALVYGLAETAYGDDGREIVNCTAGGSLEVFRRGDLKQELCRPPRAPAPSVSVPPPAAKRPAATPHRTFLDFCKSRHRGSSCRIFFDLPPWLPAAAGDTEDIISVDQKDWGFESTCVFPRYLFMTDPTLVRTNAPDLRLLTCTKFILRSSAIPGIEEDALTHVVDPSLLPDLSGCLAPSASDRRSKYSLALSLAVHLGYSKIKLPLELAAAFRPASDPKVTHLLQRHDISMAFVPAGLK